MGLIIGKLKANYITKLYWGKYCFFFLLNMAYFSTGKTKSDDLSERINTKIRRDYCVHKINKMLVADLSKRWWRL